MTTSIYCLLALLISLTLVVIRVIFCVPFCRLQDVGPVLDKPLSVLILLGSGGHTGELLSILSQLDHKFKYSFIVQSNDESSVLRLEKSQVTGTVYTVPRARNVGDGLLRSVQETLKCWLGTMKVLVFDKKWKEGNIPSVLLVNGPGSCVPLAYSIVVLNILGLTSTRIIYMESLTRVNELSLSGKLLYLVADRFVVQWPELAQKYRRTEYHGILV
ncbi:hypothetical protein LJB42_003974 [Komagataella kurtzmanii]|nr:hypothetical protein LJB42_003974 [Komagataella kurtzmanii]